MLEDEKVQMNTSASRSPAVPPKSGEPKKEAGGRNKYRQGRRWDAAASTPRAQIDFAQRSAGPPRQMERGSRPRGSGNDRQREEVKDNLRCGQEALTKTNSKKRSMNHLLNFYYESPRDSDGFYEAATPHTRGGGNSRWWKGKGGRRFYNKEQFMQASNFQFLVKEDGKYLQHAADPDSLVDWDLIEQVRVFGSQVASCPICLEKPTAARMTKCGHIYCFACMLHYLDLSEKAWGKCPICYDAIQRKDLKSVVSMETRSFAVGSEITMKLMKRERGSTLCLPVQQWTDREGKPLQLGDAVDCCYSKLLAVSPEQVEVLLDRERAELDRQKEELQETLEGSYVLAALEFLKERRAVLHMERAKHEALVEKVESLATVESKGAGAACGSGYAPLRKGGVEYVCAFDDEEVFDDGQEKPHLPVSQSAPALQALGADSEWCRHDTVGSSLGSSDDDLVTVTLDGGEERTVTLEDAVAQLAVTDRCPQASGGGRKMEFYFYQAEDGQHIYLHSVNARCLVTQYGALENSPARLTAKIVDLETLSMTQALRDRLPFLQHVPLTCTFQVAEVQLRPPVVSAEVLQRHEGELNQRKLQRQKRRQDEKRQLKKMQLKEFDRHRKDPVYQTYLGLRGECPSVPQSTIVHSAMPELVETQHGVVAAPEGREQAVTFAEKLRSGKAVAAEWPSIKKSKDTRLVDGAAKAAAVGGAWGQAPPTRDESDEDCASVPGYQESFNNALVTALANVTAKGKSADELTSGVKGKGKKRKQKTLLFSTSMARAN